MTDAYFERLAADPDRPHVARFLATEHTGGAWSEEEQHIAPMVGLVVHEIERHVAARGRADDKLLGRLTFDILGVVRLEEFDVEVETVRAGRTIELVEATVTWAGRVVVRARAWRLTGSDTGEVAGGQPAPIPGPDETPLWDMTSVWPGHFIASLTVRRSADAQPGRAHAWMASPLALVASADGPEDVSPTAAFLALVDTANGMCVRRPPDAWLFPNLDLSIHLTRAPEPGPTGLDTTIVFGPAGLGITEAVLHDVRGPVGRLSETLTLRRRHGEG
jgi:hypothetical protein